MTPRQFHLLLDRHNIVVQHQELLNGILAACIVNFSMGAPKKFVHPDDFMPTRLRQKANAKKKSKALIAIHTEHDANGNIVHTEVEMEGHKKMTKKDRDLTAQKVAMLFRR
jgi:hypothetical protein